MIHLNHSTEIIFSQTFFSFLLFGLQLLTVPTCLLPNIGTHLDISPGPFITFRYPAVATLATHLGIPPRPFITFRYPAAATPARHL